MRLDGTASSVRSFPRARPEVLLGADHVAPPRKGRAIGRHAVCSDRAPSAATHLIPCHSRPARQRPPDYPRRRTAASPDIASNDSAAGDGMVTRDM
jgi:hypothetical protein